MARPINLLLLVSSLGLGASCDGFSETTSDDSAGPGGSGAAGGVADGGGGSGATGVMGGGGQGSGGCATHADCTDAANAQCNTMATCVPCTDSSHCEGVAGLPVCDGGTCVECMLGEEDACVSPQTCDLLAQIICVDVAPGSIDQCEPCTNDNQCHAGHRCIPLEYETQHHGYYCLELPSPGCSRPYSGVLKTSINAVPATVYCGVSESVATCEAVLALQSGRFCTTDGMCSMTLGGAEFAVPGAICRQLFSGGDNKCTYRCSTDGECPSGGDGRFCGDETGTNPPDFCGGDIM